ncbi:MAG: glycosyltransferase [Pirellulales bacterium]
MLDDLNRQTLRPREIEIVRGVAPNGRARNVGIERTSCEFLVFLDDDVRLGSNDVIEKLVAALETPGVGLSGTAQQLPPDSTKFQCLCANQIPRSRSDIVHSLTDSDMVTTQCCATRRDILSKLGNFHPKILRGVDPELRARYREAGLRIVIAPDAWHYHPMPASIKLLCKMAYRNGYSSAYAQKHFPETILYNPEGHVDQFEARRSLATRVVGRARDFCLALLRGQWLRLTYDLAYATGYLRFRMSQRTI